MADVDPIRGVPASLNTSVQQRKVAENHPDRHGARQDGEEPFPRPDTLELENEGGAPSAPPPRPQKADPPEGRLDIEC